MNTILCKHCGKEIEISEALVSQVKEQAKAEFDKEHKKDLENASLLAAEKAKKEVLEASRLEAEDMKRQLDEQKKKNDELREEQLKLREERRQLEEERKDLKIEMEKQVESRLKESLERESERHRLKELELEKKLSDVQKKSDEMRIQLEQGSQQTQGEVLELDFENSLISAFPHDEIIPVEKGRVGADLRQTVKTPKGTVCGVILWEIKRTKAWANDWTEKLKSDLRAEKANIPIIVTNTFPKSMNTQMGIHDGVWVVGYSLALTLAELMRQRLIEVAREKYLAEHKDGNKDALYEYIVGYEFVQVVESLLEVQQEMLLQIQREKAAFEKQWKQRMEYSDKLLKGTARMVGSIQGKLGSSAHLQIKGIDMLTLDDGK